MDEGHTIVDIEYTSEEWWAGTNAQTGAQGLFPSVSCVTWLCESGADSCLASIRRTT